ncbi:MAG TPA: aldehyde ferredoxin oxidoreductase family protein [Spirochaetia bacterium]|nr:aldehyde ferredoxin oxidoreductase family protein [Spirochaetia bacterium]
MHGYNGKILFVDLSTGAIREEAFDESFARTFLGGNGFAAKLIHDRVPAKAEPTGEENGLVIATGPLTGTPVWGTSRGHVASLSPQSGMFADSNFGGNFGTALKRAGVDALYISGRSETPLYLLVSEGRCELKDAGELWGKPTGEAMALLEEKEGREAVSAVIGPAGENLVSFANIVFGGVRRGMAGRCGMGAVMGSKGLKAVVAAGRKNTETASPRELTDFLKTHLKSMRENTSVLTEEGTPFLVEFINSRGKLGTRNNTRETFKLADRIGTEAVQRGFSPSRAACLGCPVSCGKIWKASTGAYAGQVVKLPEYESLYALGSMMDNGDLASIVEANAMCDNLGMDTISMGLTLSFLAECMERGIVSQKEIGAGIRFSDGMGMLELIRATAYRQGAGEILAQGSERIAKSLDPDAALCLNSVKGLEMSGHSARGIRSMALGYATSPRGGSHHDTRPNYVNEDVEKDPEGQAAFNIQSQNFSTVGDCLILCRFVGERGFKSLYQQSLADMLRFVTGWEIDKSGLERTGERIYNLERLINVRRGAGRKHDALPYRVLNEPIPDGPAEGSYFPKESFEAALSLYYLKRGWSEDGIPSPEKLRQLGL